jgi:hypothetical protein
MHQFVQEATKQGIMEASSKELRYRRIQYWRWISDRIAVVGIAFAGR